MFARYKISIKEVLAYIGGEDCFRMLLNSEEFKVWERRQSDVLSGETLNKLIYGNGGVIKVKVLEDKQFPITQKQVFISHSSKDKNLAKVFAYELHKLGIDCFVDSINWNNISQLQKELDQKYCWLDEDNKIYSYNKRNDSTAHVHAILSTALFKMIDNCECGIFIDSDNSIIKLKDITGDSTFSPWIYEEINYIDKIRPNIPERFKESFKRTCYSDTGMINESDQQILRMVYQIDALENFKILNAEIMTCMQKAKNIIETNGLESSGEDVLDCLYLRTQYLWKVHQTGLYKKLHGKVTKDCGECKLL